MTDQIKEIVDANNDKIIYNNVINHNLTAEEHNYVILQGLNLELNFLTDFFWKKYKYDIFSEIKNQNLTLDKKNEILLSLKFEDDHWSWFKKSEHFKDTSNEWFYLIIDNIPQGICIIYYPKDSFLSKDNKICYIEYIAIAPWNRKTKLYEREFKSIGTKLIQISLDFSSKQKLNDGFSLQSLPQTYSYYEKLGMINITEKDEKSLKYYEMPEEISLKLRESL